MSKFAIIATFEIEQGQKEALLPLLKAHNKRCVDNESGTLQMDLLEPQDDDNRIMLYEVYQDETAFGQHWNGQYVKQTNEETKGMIKNISGIRCAIIE